MPCYVIRVTPTDAPVRDLPHHYRTKADARRVLTMEATILYPNDTCRKDNPDCIVVWRGEEYQASVSIERAD